VWYWNRKKDEAKCESGQNQPWSTLFDIETTETDHDDAELVVNANAMLENRWPPRKEMQVKEMFDVGSQVKGRPPSIRLYLKRPQLKPPKASLDGLF
jgi:hypothetical protein